MLVSRIAFVVLAVVFGACGSPRSRLPAVREIYADAALDQVRNPVIVIHGILGARIAQRSTGKTVWGAFTNDGVDPETKEGARAVALPFDPPKSALDYDPLDEDVYADGPLEKLQLSVLYQVLSVEVYAQIIRTLGAGGYTDEVVGGYSPKYADDHFSCHTFFYDWRRDNVENAIQLGAFIEQKREEITDAATQKIERLRKSGEAADAVEADRLRAWLDKGFRFDIVAHSMGGLVARYFLRYGANDLPADGSTPEVTWAGSEDVDRLVMVGTPNLGSMFALRHLYSGFRPARILPLFSATLLGTMPSIFQLLPRERHHLIVDGFGDPFPLDFMDPKVWEENRWGFFAPRQREQLAWLMPEMTEEERLAAARQYLRWSLARAKQFHAALDSMPSMRSPSQMFLFAGDVVPTLARVRAVERLDGTYRLSFTGRDLYVEGDETVPRYSAIGDDRFGGPYRSRVRTAIPWSNVTFLSDDHIGLTSNPHFTDNMLFLLLEWSPPMR